MFHHLHEINFVCHLLHSSRSVNEPIYVLFTGTPLSLLINISSNNLLIDVGSNHFKVYSSNLNSKTGHCQHFSKILKVYWKEGHLIKATGKHSINSLKPNSTAALFLRLRLEFQGSYFLALNQMNLQLCSSIKCYGYRCHCHEDFGFDFVKQSCLVIHVNFIDTRLANSLIPSLLPHYLLSVAALVTTKRLVNRLEERILQIKNALQLEKLYTTNLSAQYSKPLIKLILI